MSSVLKDKVACDHCPPPLETRTETRASERGAMVAYVCGRAVSPGRDPPMPPVARRTHVPAAVTRASRGTGGVRGGGDKPLAVGAGPLAPARRCPSSSLSGRHSLRGAVAGIFTTYPAWYGRFPSTGIYGLRLSTAYYVCTPYNVPAYIVTVCTPRPLRTRTCLLVHGPPCCIHGPARAE